MTTPPRKLVLVVDDSEVALESAQIALEDAGFRVIALDNPLLLTSIIRRETPALILMDVNMPTLRGDQVLEIANRHGSIGKVPVLLHSDLPEPDLAERARQCGAAGFIQKTADEADFIRRVKQWLTP